MGARLARLAAPVHLYRPVAGDGGPVGHHAQADDLPADRRDSRGADRRAARAGRRERNWDYRYTWIRDGSFTTTLWISLIAFIALYGTLATVDFLLMLRYSRQELPPPRDQADAGTPVPAVLY